MKTTLLGIFLLFNFFACFSQTNEWVWISGDSVLNINSIYGTKGVEAPSNKPGGKDYPLTWTDKTGNLWLFGGQGLAASGGPGNLLNDLWKYNITNDQWTWVGGDNVVNVYGVYGKRGVAAAGNKPGSRFLSVCWTDKDGNFWLFGGDGFGASGGVGDLNDLWKYTVASGEWTWISGDTSINIHGVYGTKGIPGPANKPGSRNNPKSWTDQAGNLWLFAGENYVGNGYLNDLWKFDVTTNEWTWECGDSIPNINAIYGTKGTTDPANKPGSRYPDATWTDNAGNLWLFAGQGFDGSGNVGNLNDIWEYNIASGEWTWIGGDNTINNKGVYGTWQTAAAANKPGSRQAPINWKDNAGNFWIFGGIGEDAVGAFGGLDDLWKYTVSTGEWTWMNGDSTVNHNGRYGTRGVAAPTNTPGGRWNLSSWTDNLGNLWLFGGFGLAASGSSKNDLNDLWKFNSGDSIPSLPVALFIASIDTVCSGNTVSFVDQSSNTPTSWKWTFAGGTPDTSTAENPTVTYTVSGSYDVKLVVSNAKGEDSITRTKYITVNPLPVAGLVTANPDSVCAGVSTQLSVNGTTGTIQWQSSDNGISFTDIAGASSSTYNTPGLTQVIYYRVKVNGTCGADSSAGKAIIVISKPFAGVINSLKDTICEGTLAHLTVSGNTDPVQWQSSLTTSAFQDITGVKSITYNPLINQNTYFRVYTTNGKCSDTSIVFLMVTKPSPVAAFSASDSLLQITFNSDGSTSATSYLWDFGDITSSTDANPVHTYDSSGNFHVCLTVFNATNCNFTICHNIDVNASGTNNINNAGSFIIYPNPFSSSVLVDCREMNSSITGIEIYDVIGKMVMDKRISNKPGTLLNIDLKSLSKGMYYIKIRTGKGNYTGKMIKE